MKNEYELPPVAFCRVNDVDSNQSHHRQLGVSADTKLYTEDQVRAANEADRKRRGEPVQCPTCGTHEVSLERTCHNSTCSAYGVAATVYEGWKTPPAEPVKVPSDPAVAAIQFALATDEAIPFLHCWNEGNFDAIRREWPEAPESVFIGADPLHPETRAVLGLYGHSVLPAEPVKEAEGALRDFLDSAKEVGIERLDLAHIYDEPVKVPSAIDSLQALHDEAEAMRKSTRHDYFEGKADAYSVALRVLRQHGQPAQPDASEDRERLMRAIVEAGQQAGIIRADLETVSGPECLDILDCLVKPVAATFRPGDRVRKTKGSRWQGRVVGTYSTALTPEGYAVESETETGSVQIYPAHALEIVEDSE